MSTSAITPRPHLARLSPYQPGGKLEYDGPIAFLASNENPLGPSPAAVEAMAEAARGVHLYPDPTYQALTEAIAAAHAIEAVDRIVVGAGSDEVLDLLIRAYAGPGDEVLHTAHAFAMYRIGALAHGATPVSVPERDLTADVDALLDRAGPATKLVFLADPNNPTGTMVGADAIRRLRAELPAHTLLVVDGAYAECVDPAVYAELLAFARDRDDVAITRTFSKLYGLAAVRLGWGYLPSATAALIQQMRSPFNVTSPADAAGRAAVADRAHLDASVTHLVKARDELRSALTQLDLPTPESHGNFVLPRFPSPEAANSAAAHLRARGVLVRVVAGYGLPDRLRISIGTAHDHERLLDGLRGWLAREPQELASH